MKFEPISSRETTVQHYGKRGIGWHGFCMQYFLLEHRIDEDGVIFNDPIKYIVYLDQVLEDGNKQDSCTVFSLLEAAISQFINDLPFINEVILQSDNAMCY